MFSELVWKKALLIKKRMQRIVQTTTDIKFLINSVFLGSCIQL